MQKILLLFVVAVCISCHESDPLPSVLKLKSVTSYIQDQQGAFRPGEKTIYAYSAGGMLESAEQLQYDSQDKEFHHFSTDNYAYDHGVLMTISKNILGGSHNSTTRYEYLNKKISKITLEDNVTTVASVQYMPGDTINVLYQLSNGRSFTYAFHVKESSISYEKTIDDDRKIASESRHTYDSFLNPYQLLGYTDMYFNNYSIHNKVTSSSNYYALAFPQSIPVAYSYQYNEQEYPTEQITTYKATGSSAMTGKSKTVFEYTY